jgi:surface polysaccharide O-acyltransferase-like enzyme
MTEPSAQTSRQTGIDVGRCIAFVGVVLIHCASSLQVSYLAQMACRFAVPFFFVTSGYFMSASRPAGEIIGKSFRRIAPIYLFWVVAYAVILRSWPSDLSGWLALMFTGGAGAHLWFLPSLFLCVALCALIRPLGWAWGGAIVVALYLAGLACGAYGPLVGVHQDLWDPRSGILFGSIFVYAGMLIRNRGIALDHRVAIALFLVLIVLQVLEIVIVSKAHSPYHDFYILTVPLGVAAFLAARAIPWDTALLRWIAALGPISLGMYAVHLFFVRFFESHLRIATLSGWALTVPAVVVLSVLTAYALSRTPYLRTFVR